MQVLSLVWGILAIIGMVIGFFPCLGALNWVNIPFSAVGLLLGLTAFNKAKPADKKMAIIGSVLCGIAVILGLMRLILGLGVI